MSKNISFAGEVISSSKIEQMESTMQDLLARAATDRDFRTQLLTNPRAALAEFRGVPIDSIPEDVPLAFVENAGGTTIVIPDYVGSGVELSADELEGVAGGGTPALAYSIAVTAYCTYKSTEKLTWW
jgi:hypothetical protein